MAKPKTKTNEALLSDARKVLTPTEATRILESLQAMDPEQFKEALQRMAMMMRGFDGKPIEPKDVIDKLIDISKLSERTRFINALYMNRNIYLNVLAAKTGIQAYKDWADQEARSLIAYQGEGRKETIEIHKASGMIAQGISPVFLEGTLPEPRKGRFQRLRERIKPKGEEKE